ncbi:lysosome-associated membrane glycoprotein 1 [Nilaparvata lugens]|uniref:lysosome-associated membrane glycoprotein 1 n=1 Tax=Nilaparvata lugens TaxID=108931 RepID=UPI00193D6F15|nr:lysosome-associated membrane glycoprotein 1 [Nilaparvata lugens]
MAIARQCLLVTIFIVATLFTGAIQGAEPIPDSKTPPTTPSTSTVTTSTAAPDTTTISTPGPDTTTTSTTAKPDTTTPPSTTAAPSTTTVAPSTTTLAPSTTPAPPQPAVGNWTIHQDNHTCAIFRAAITVKLAFDDKANKTQHFDIKVPYNATVGDPKCGQSANESISFSLEFPAGHVAMTFKQNHSQYYLQEVHSWINATALPDLAKQTNATNFTLTYTAGAAASNLPLEASVGRSYVCGAPAALALNNGSTLALASVTYQAYLSDGKLGPEQNCVTDSSPDMIPMLVAGGLILFVVLILVAYIVTRQRQARGYHSM